MNFSLLELWQATGVVARTVVVFLTLLSLASIALGVERLLALRKAAGLSARFLELWRGERHTAGSTRPPAAGAPGSHAEDRSEPLERSPAALLLHALNEIGAGTGLAPGSAESAYDRTMRRMLLAMGQSYRRGVGFLATVGSTAPFIGLFGTVTGIVDAFRQMSVTGQGGLATVSGGIAEALVTTALGILVAIPALWLYNTITARVTALLTELECAAEELAVIRLSEEARPRRGFGSHAVTAISGPGSGRASLVAAARPDGERS